MGGTRAPLAFTVGLAAVAAATTWVTLLSWRTFVAEAAPVTITAETIDLTVEVAQLLDELKQLPGVLRADILAA